MHVTIGQFTGPLDLLLSLIQGQKMEISEVSISKVTEQYIAYLEQLEETNAEELADFLVIASKILFLKSRSLLDAVVEDEEEGVPLEDQLKLYRMFVNYSKHIDERWNAVYTAYERREPVKIPDSVPLPDNLTMTIMHSTIHDIIERITPRDPLPETKIDKGVSLREIITRLREVLAQEKNTSFYRHVSRTGSRTEVIVHFLALLELVKCREIEVDQSQPFSDISISTLSV